MPEKGRRTISAFAAVLVPAAVAGLSLFAVAASGSNPPLHLLTVTSAQVDYDDTHHAAASTGDERHL